MPSSADKPLYTTLRFIPSNGDSNGGTRRIAAHACESCRRKKKRCTHTPDALLVSNDIAASNDYSRVTPASMTGSSASRHGNSLIDTARPRKRVRTSDARPSTSRSEPSHSHSEPSHSRFIGDLNPDVELLSGSTPNEPLRNNVGVWHSDDAQSSRPADSRDMFAPSSLLHIASGSTQEHLTPLIEELCLRIRPTETHFQALEKFYFDSIDPVLPAIDASQYYSSAHGSPSRILQEQTICILASLNPSMAEHLLLPNHEGCLSPAEFARKVVGGMRLVIELALVTNKTLVIRALVAMSLITYGPESIDLTSQYFVRAVHLAYTIGVHLPQDQARDQRVAGLFCYIWSIDRLHAAIQGRPIFLHEIDMGKSPRDCMTSQTPGFQTLIYIATLLDRTIALYRPGAVEKEIADCEFPTFEEIMAECGALGLPSNMLATLELFYHAVAILSCRYRGSSSQGRVVRNTRQTSSAQQINSIMEETALEELVLLPFVPYAVSLALSAAYRDFKHCKTASHRTRARRRLAQSNHHLLSLGSMFWSAAFVSEMATKILRETEDGGQERVAAPGPPAFETGDDAHASQDATRPIDVAFGHEWNTTDMDFFLEGTLDPSMPWDMEGLLAFPSVDYSVPRETDMP